MSTRRPAPFLQLAAVAAVPALALVGCGSGEESAGSGGVASGQGSSSASATECPPEEGAKERVTSFDDPPPMCIDEKKSYTALVTTDLGEVTMKLDPKQAPQTVNNFVVLARYKFYDGLSFHRVIPGFMAQGGDPEGTGAGGPGYEFDDELPEAGDYEIGSVAMANAGPNTNGSQFFVVTGDAGVALDPSYSLFGTVTKGMDVMQKIEADGSESGQPSTVHTIESVTITEK